MKIDVNPRHRVHVVHQVARPTEKLARQLILDHQHTSEGFQTLVGQAHCVDDTQFTVLANRRELLVAVCLIDSVPWLSKLGSQPWNDSVEILFSPWNDEVGYSQFIFGPPPQNATSDTPHRDPDTSSEVQQFHHTPYPQASVSSYRTMPLLRYRWQDEVTTSYHLSGRRCRWLFAWFNTRDVFAHGPVSGFNICRHRPYLDEFGCWNHASGNGAPDATGFGRLYHHFEDSAQLVDIQANRSGTKLELAGGLHGKASKFDLILRDTLGREQSVAVTRKGRNTWHASVDIRGLAGRLRFYPRSKTEIEPRYFAVDLPSPRAAKAFTLSVTLDTPMNFVSAPYTPERLDREMQLWRQQGISRIHWIEYGHWPSFFQRSKGPWRENYNASIRNCGDLLTAGVRAAHRHGLEIIADIKPFDLGMNCFVVEDDGESAVLDLENRHVSAIPEIARAQAHTMQAHPDLQLEPTAPIASLRFYSLKPLPRLKASNVQLLVSKDNRSFKPLRRGFKFKQGIEQRPHRRWTPVGLEPAPGSEPNHYIELSNLSLTEPYAALRIVGKSIEFTQRGYMIIQAQSTDGQQQPTTIATNGSVEKGGFFFWKGWQGWANITEPLLQMRTWSGPEVGLVFRQARSMPTLLEPADDASHPIWLGRLQSAIKAGVDGVSIRTYCHHNGPMHYLQFAFAPAVLAQFRQQFGRDPRMNNEDYARIRQIRSQGYTRFIEAARQLTRSRGRQLMVEIESGIELPATLDSRMQLPLDWKDWTQRNLVDELRLKWLTAANPFVHEQVLPVAGAAGVPVSVISRNLPHGFGARAVEMADRTISLACASGLAGYTWYEHQNLVDSAGPRVVFKGPVEAYFNQVRKTLSGLEQATSRSGA